MREALNSRDLKTEEVTLQGITKLGTNGGNVVSSGDRDTTPVTGHGTAWDP